MNDSLVGRAWLITTCKKAAKIIGGKGTLNFCRKLLVPLGITLTEDEQADVNSIRKTLIRKVCETLRLAIVEESIACGFIKIGKPLPLGVRHGSSLAVTSITPTGLLRISLDKMTEGADTGTVDALTERFMTALEKHLAGT